MGPIFSLHSRICVWPRMIRPMRVQGACLRRSFASLDHGPRGFCLKNKNLWVGPLLVQRPDRIGVVTLTQPENLTCGTYMYAVRSACRK